jgi:hypothetical protein
MWRNGQALRPYFEDVKVVVKMKDSIPELTGYNIVSEDKLSFVHFPIKDCGITGKYIFLITFFISFVHY